MIKLFKRLFCSHRIKFLRDIYGDSINHYDARSIYECEKCGKIFKSNELGNEAKIFKLERDLKASKSVNEQLSNHIKSINSEQIIPFTKNPPK